MKRNSDLFTSTTITGKTAGGRSERQHECEKGVGHAISAHDELGACHVDGCNCPGYEEKNAAAANAAANADAPLDPRDRVVDQPQPAPAPATPPAS